MNEVDKAIERLVEAVKESQEYVEYRCQLDKINRQPGLRERVDTFRNENFELQTNTPEDELMEKLEQFEEKYQTFRENPLVNDFLAAELAFCRMMQDVNLRITAGLQFE